MTNPLFNEDALSEAYELDAIRDAIHEHTAIDSHDEDTWNELIEQLEDDDFEYKDFRFIRVNCIDEIQREELLNDLYILGCFNTDFLAGVQDAIPFEALEEMKEAEAFEAIGKCMGPYIDEIQASYASLDGYGHHFARYDGNEHEIGSEWLVFQVN